ncbi:MAG: hypothetical protein GF383_04650 [Candidatus Lokiarchaeota archaeon]|nr:hypothetical protein [Candidatus Lokiarchaeota archaeon]MBD3339084.1 hypothetical protein [Candidatus Lokiarchaeota archaeon]
MSDEKKLRFCFYCGNLIQNYVEGGTTNCPKCGVKLHYNNQSKKNKSYSAH